MKAKVWFEKLDATGSITLNGNIKARKVSDSGKTRRRGKVSVGGTFQ